MIRLKCRTAEPHFRDSAVHSFLYMLAVLYCRISKHQRLKFLMSRCKPLSLPAPSKRFTATLLLPPAGTVIKIVVTVGKAHRSSLNYEGWQTFAVSYTKFFYVCSILFMQQSLSGTLTNAFSHQPFYLPIYFSA